MITSEASNLGLECQWQKWAQGKIQWLWLSLRRYIGSQIVGPKGPKYLINESWMVSWLMMKYAQSLYSISISALLTMPKPLTVWITINRGKFWKRWEYQTTWPASWEIYMQVRKQQLELDMEQQTGSKQENEYVKAVNCHHAYLTYMQSTSWETLAWRKHKL